MDILINIIIIVTIALFILKRMREVTQKGKDITGPPHPEPIFEEDRRVRMPRQSRPLIDEHVFETTDEEESHISEPTGEPRAIHASTLKSGSQRRARAGSGPMILLEPCFTRNGLVRGVIMSEILGPPVGVKSPR